MPRKRKPRDPLKKRIYNYQYRYGITVEQHDEMLKAQNGVCAICGKPPKRRRLQVDHHHESGAVRELLCVPCNTSLAYIEDPFWFAAATDYLNRHHPERTPD